MPPSHLRIQDRFLDYVRKYLINAKLSKIFCEKDKMIISFEYRKEGIVNKFYLGWHERHLYFDQQPLDQKIGFTMPNESSTTRLSWSLEDYFKSKNFDESKKVVQKKKEKFLQRKIQNIKKDIEKNSKWRIIESKLDSGELDLSGNELLVCDEKIKFLNAKNEWQKRDQIYKKIKKLRKGEEILSKRLSESEVEELKTKSGIVEFELTKESAIQPCWPGAKKSTIRSSAKSNTMLIKIENIAGIVGLDSSGNDSIRSGANKDHYWFHLESYKGAHCILKTDDQARLSPVILAAIASMLRDLSHLAITEIPVIFTQLKNVKGVRGEQGKVIVNKAKHLRCNYIAWKEIISI